MELNAKSALWATDILASVVGYEVDADMCRFGMQVRNRHGHFMGYSDTTMKVRTTSRRLAEAICLKCICPNPHAGSMLAPVRGPQPWNMAKAIADILMISEEQAMVVDAADPEYNLDLLKALRKKHADVTIKQVKKYHDQLGHPSNIKLMAALKDIGATAAVISCAREYACEACLKRQRPRAARIVALASAKAFGDVVDMDTYHIKHGTKKYKVLALMDEYTRYEVDHLIKKETSGNVVRSSVKGWVNTFGAMRMLRTDMAGAHMSQRLKDFCTAYHVKLQLIPEGAHHRLGALERNHAVRREQIGIFLERNPSYDVAKSVTVTCAARNRLHNARGYSPVQRVFGSQPRLPGGLDEEYFSIAENDSRTQEGKVLEDMRMRADAAEAYHQANMSEKLRAAMLARNRPIRREYVLGEWVYYWRTAKDSKLVKAHWHGPGMVVCNEVSGTDEDRATTVWVVHGASLLRCTPEQLRPEFPEESRRRTAAVPATTTAQPVFERMRHNLRGTRGPVNFADLAGGDLPEPPDEEMGSDNDEMDVEAQAGPAPGPPEPQAPDEHVGEVPHPEPEQDLAQPVLNVPVPALAQASVPSEALLERAIPPASPSAPAAEVQPRGSPRRALLDELMDSEDTARRLDGLPALKRSRSEGDYQDMERRIEEAKQQPVPDDEEVLLAAEHEDEVYMTKAKGDEIAWGRLSVDEQALFQEAKREACMVFIENKAWKPIHWSQCNEAYTAPLRFLLKWKTMDDGTRKPNARVIWQGFKHSDSVSKVLDKESPTLSRLGRNVIVMISGIYQWPLFTADVKSAFLQADEVTDKATNYGIPNRDMQRILGLNEDEYLWLVKPMFGDPRAPRFWNDKFFGELRRLDLRQHALDKCVWFVHDEHGELDGIVGIHVDDMIGAMKPDGAMQKACAELATRLKFGKWSTGADLVFTGCELRTENGEITIMQGSYMHKVLPISIEKHRKTELEDDLRPKEHTALRALMGALQWPAGQSMPHGAATVSLLSADIGKPKVKHIAVANKALRFFKETADVPLRYGPFVKNLADVRLGVYTDAAWANRADNSSQGGFLVFAIDEDGIQNGTTKPLVVLDWASRKLRRVCRSSLSAEAQAACVAVDALEWTKIFVTLLIYPDKAADDEQLCAALGISPVVTDAKALYDASRSEVRAWD